MSIRLPLKQLQKLKRHRFILNKIAKAKGSKRAQMVNGAPLNLFSIFKIICSLVSKDQLKIGKAKRHRALISNFTTKTPSAIKASKQHGGAIGAIIAGVLPFLASLLSKVLK